MRVPLEKRVRWFYGLTALAILATLLATIVWLGPLPPRVVLMSTGTPGSDYASVAERYRTILKRSGVELRLLPSGGGVENLQRLSDRSSGVSVAFAQGGLTNEKASPQLQSLGTVFFQPLWFFRRSAFAGVSAQEMAGKRVSVGPVGGGTRVLAMKFIALNGLDRAQAQIQSLPPAAAGAALLKDELDAALMVASWQTPVVRELLASGDVDLVSFPRADAYVALFPYLHKLVLPAGVGSLANSRPPADVSLLAPKASLIVRRDLHPAIQYLLLEAASEIHSAPELFQRSGEFPAAERDDLPLSAHASQFYRSGPPFLQRYLPFWLAVLASSLLVLLIPIVGIAYPLLRVAPALYGWNMRRRIFRLYGELKFIESELESANGKASPALTERLQHLDERASHVRVPNAFAHFLYELRTHIGLVRQRIGGAGPLPDRAAAAVPSATAPRTQA